MAAEKAKKAAQAAAKKAADLAKTASAKAADRTKKTGNPAQKSSQAKANPTSSSAASSGGGGKKPAAPASKGDNASGGGRSDGGSSGGDTGCRTAGNSFVPGTRVLMANGTSKPIEDIKTGDTVQATEAETGETETKTVTATITGHGVKHLVEIVIDTDGEHGSDTAAITATDGHPFWVPELGRWLDATDLQPGQWLQTSAGTWIQITAIDRWTTPSATVHNLTVSDIHTYYVIAGATPVLVHNNGGLPYDACPVMYPVNKLRHGAYGEDETRADLEAGGYTHITDEVTFTDRNGNPFRADFIAKDPNGDWIAIETKTSGGGASGRVAGPDVVSRMGIDQVTGYYDLVHGGLKLSTDKLTQFGFSHGDNFTVSNFGKSSKLCPHC